MRFLLCAGVVFLAAGSWAQQPRRGSAQRRPAPATGGSAAEAHYQAGAAAIRKHDYGAAIPELRKALELQPGLNDAHALLGQALLDQGYAREALPHLERSGQLYLHALALLQVNRVPEAIQELLQVAARRPNDPEVLFYLGKASGELMQQSFTRLLGQYPDSALAHELRGQNLLGQGRGDLAEPELRKALAIDPSLPGLHLALGRILMDRGDLDGAEKELRTEVARSPGNAEAAWRLGSVLLTKGQGKEALAELQRSDRLKPEMLETLLDLGKAYLMDSQLEPAEKTFRRIIAIDDSNEIAAAAHLQLSQICRRLGKTDEAAQHLRRFRELNPQKGPNPQ